MHTCPTSLYILILLERDTHFVFVKCDVRLCPSLFDCHHHVHHLLFSIQSRPEPPSDRLKYDITFGKLDDDRIPFPRTSGARFCANGEQGHSRITCVRSFCGFSDSLQRSSSVFQPSAVSIGHRCSRWTNTQVISNCVTVTWLIMWDWSHAFSDPWMPCPSFGHRWNCLVKASALVRPPSSPPLSPREAVGPASTHKAV